MIRRLRDRLADDSGITLPEVIVVALLAVLVLGAVGGAYIGSIGVQKLVGSLTQATAGGQLVAASIDRSIRNGSEFEITTLPSGDQLVRIRSIDASEGAVWHCVAYYYSASEATIRTHTEADDTVIDVPAAETLATWTLLAQRVALGEAAAVFGVDPNATTVLAVDFTTVDADDAGVARIKFSTPLMPEAQPEGSCF